MKKTVTYLPVTTHALKTLGTQIAVARRELGWTASDLAERLGVTTQLVSRIEHGAPSTAIGTVFEAAVLCRIPLFGIDVNDVRAMSNVAENQRLRLALLPSRVRRRSMEVDNDF